MKPRVTHTEFHARLIELAVEAGADRGRASERMAQAAGVYAAEVDTTDTIERVRAELERLEAELERARAELAAERGRAA